MKNFTKILAVVIALTFVLTTAAVGIFAGTETAWYQAAVSYLDSNKITNIGEDGDKPVTRDEFVTWVAKIESHQLVESAWNSHKYETVATSTFTDVTDSEHKGAIGYAVNREFINGYGDGTFGPHNTVKLAEACAVIVRMMGYQDLVDASDWAYNNMHVANVTTDCMDSAFLNNTGTADPDYELTKGEAAWLLYKTMNGVYHVAGYTDNEYKVLVNTNKIHLTNLGVDLGAWFYSSDSVNTTLKLVVTNLPLHYKSDYYYSGNNSTMIATPLYSNSSGNYASFFRFDALTAGAKYDSLLNYKVLKSDGRIDESDPDAVVTLTNVQNGDVYTLTVAEFCTLVRKAIGTTSTTVNLSLAVELGSAIIVKSISKDYRKYVDGIATFYEVIDSVTVANSVVADTYIGSTAETTANDANGLTAVGWTSYSVAAAGNSALKRVSDNYTNWDGDTLLVNGEAYKVVTAYTGAANEIKVFAPNGIVGTAKVVSAIRDAGDKVYEGGIFSADQKAKLVAYNVGFTDADFNASGANFVAKATKALTARADGIVAYELEVPAFTTNLALNTVSAFIGADGRLDDNVIGFTPLTVAQAKEYIISPVQGECNVVFSDTNGDGYYDIAVVTESTRFTFYGDVNAKAGLNGVEGNLGDGSVNASEVYDSFGNYISNTMGDKGQAIGGLVIDKPITTNGGQDTSDSWQIADGDRLKSTGKIQLVVCASSERLATLSVTQVYSPNGMGTYAVVDVANLTTGYIEKVYMDTVTIDGVQYYEANVIVGKDTKTLYIPVNPAEKITLDVTLDGVTSPVTFAAGKQLLSFVTDHNANNQIGDMVAVNSGAWMAGHTVKFVANENGVVWCMVETATSGMTNVYHADGTNGAFHLDTNAVRGFVTNIVKNNKGDSLYDVTVVTSGAWTSGAVASTAIDFTDTAWLKSSITLDCPTLFYAYGREAVLDPTTPVKVYVVTQDLIDYIESLGSDYVSTKTVTTTIKNTQAGYDDGMGTFYQALVDALGTITIDITVGAPGTDADATKTITYKWTSMNVNRIVKSNYGNRPIVGVYGVDGLVGDVTGTTYPTTSDGKLAMKGQLGNYANAGVAQTWPAGTVISDVDYKLQIWGDELEAIAADLGKTFFETATVPFSALTGYANGIKFDVVGTGAAGALYNRETGKKLQTITVKASATSVWDYTPEMYAIVNNLVTKGVIYSSQAVAGERFDSTDLLYLSFSKDAGKYYTIEGVDPSAYAYASTGFTNDYAGIHNTSVFGINFNNVASAPNNYRTRVYAWFYIPAYYGKAAATWVAGGATSPVLGGTFNNSYVLSIAPTAGATRVDVLDGSGRVIGYTLAYDITVGSNPYYYRTAYIAGNASYELRLDETVYTGVDGLFYYTIDMNKTVLIELYKEGGTKRVLVSDNAMYNNTDKYYVNDAGEVYLIYDNDNDGIGDIYYTTTTTSSNPYFADLTAGTPVVTNDKTVDKALESKLVSVTLKPQDSSESGYVPGTYYVSLNNGINDTDVKTFKMSEDDVIVVINPDNEAGKPVYTEVSVAKLAELAAEGKNLFVTDYQYDGTTAICTRLSVIGYIDAEPNVIEDNSLQVKDGETLVKVDAGTKVIVSIVETGKYWVIETVSEAKDAVTGATAGTISFRYSTYDTDDRTVYANAASIAAGGYYVINSANVVVNDTVSAADANAYIAAHK